MPEGAGMSDRLTLSGRECLLTSFFSSGYFFFDQGQFADAKRLVTPQSHKIKLLNLPVTVSSY